MDALSSFTRCFSAASTTDGFSPFRISTMPVTTSSSLSCPSIPWRGTAPTVTCATSLTRIGVPPREATTTLPMSSADRSKPMPRTRYCCAPCSDVAPAGVRVAAAERVGDLEQRHVVVAKLFQIGHDLVLLDQAAHRHDVGDAGRQLEIPRDGPVLYGAKIGRAHPVAPQAIAIDLADRRGERRELRRDPVRQVGGLQALEHLLAREVVVHLVVEREHDIRQAELRVREHPHVVRQAGETQLDRDCDLFLDLLGGAPCVQRDDVDLDVGDVGERFDRQRFERENAAGDEEQRHQQHEQRLMQRERNDASNHATGPVTNARWSGTIARARAHCRPPPVRPDSARRSPEPGRRAPRRRPPRVAHTGRAPARRTRRANRR